MSQSRRAKQFPERYVPADGSRLVDPERGYLIAGFRDDGAYALPGDRFYNAVWSRDLSGTCYHGRHAQCAHNPGGKHAAGVVQHDPAGGRHVWRCGCDCHRRRHVTKYAGASTTIRDMSSSDRVALGGRYEPGTPLPARDEAREDGYEYETSVIGETACQACGADIPQRERGRMRLFCDSTCRQRHHRGLVQGHRRRRRT